MATKQERLDLIVRARNQSRAVLNQVNSDVGRLAGLVTGPAGLAVGMVYLGKKIYGTTMELAEHGAEVQRTSDTYASLIGGYEIADVALESLRRTTKGGVSDQRLMAASSKFLSMHLASNAVEVEHLARMSTQLGMAMNMPGGPTKAMEYFALMLANKSIRRLDEFGISGERVRQRLKAMGSSVANDADFMAAVLAEGAVTMQRVGEQSVTSWEAQEAAVENLKDEIGRYLSRLTGIPDIVADVAQQTADAMREESDAYAGRQKALEEYLAALDREVQAGRMSADERLAQWREVVYLTGSALWTEAESYDRALSLLRSFGPYLDIVVEKHAAWREELTEMEPWIKATSGSIEFLQFALDALHVTDDMRDFADWVKDVFRDAKELESAKFAHFMFQYAEDFPAQIAIYENMMGRYTEIDNEYWYWKLKRDKAVKRLDDQRLDDIKERNRELERLQDEHLTKMRSAVESALTATTVTEEDMLAARMGVYDEKWDEAMRQLKALAETGVIGEDWYEYFTIPEDILAQGPEAIKRWGSEMMKAGMRAEWMSKEGFLRALDLQLEIAKNRREVLAQAMLWAQEKYPDIAMGPEAIAAAAGVPVDQEAVGQAAGEDYRTGFVSIDYASVLIKTISTQINDRKEEITTIGAVIGRQMLIGMESSITPASLDRLIDIFGPAFVDYLAKRGYL